LLGHRLPGAALCIIEYDGLPAEFCVDMAKQLSDESRHARVYLMTAIQMLTHVSPDSKTESFWFEEGKKGLALGRGLPIPNEGNLYSVVIGADLVERLILMHHRTELPGVRTKRQRLNGSRFLAENEDISITHQFDLIDEISHAKIGKKWLKYLVPDKIELETRVVETDLLRAILIANAVSCADGALLTTTLAAMQCATADQHAPT
jgi:hypothetical protein